MASENGLAGDHSPASDSPAEAEAKPEPPPSLQAPASSEEKRWPGWPGDTVFRLIVPVLKVGSIIGRKGELIKKLCEETRARVRILDAPAGTADRIVLISGKEEPEVEISPAMDAVLRVVMRVNGIPENEGDAAKTQSFPCIILVRLLVASTQAISLIGKQGALIKSIQERCGAAVRVLSGDELPSYVTMDERIVEIQGEPPKVLRALESVVQQLRKFLVDHSVIPLFEKSVKPAVAQDRGANVWTDNSQSLTHPVQQHEINNDFSLSKKGDSLYLDHEHQLDSQFQHSALSLYGKGPAPMSLPSSRLGRPSSGFVAQVTQTMQIPLVYAEDIIGAGGRNIAYIRAASNAVLSIHETPGLPDDITVEIKGTSTQVQTAQQLIEDFMAGRGEPATASGYGSLDTGLQSMYSQMGNTGYSSSLTMQSLGRYGSSGIGGYGGGYRF